MQQNFPAKVCIEQRLIREGYVTDDTKEVLVCGITH